MTAHPVASASPVRDLLPTASEANLSATYTMDCACCEGSGVIVSIMRVAGEACDADLSETRCEACEGQGTFELCEICDNDVIDGHCSQCAEDNGQFGVGL